VNHSVTAITQTNIARIFSSAYERVANMEIAVRAFEITGFYSFNRNVFSHEGFTPSEVTLCSGVQENQVTVEDIF
jgi:hypothetical protein